MVGNRFPSPENSVRFAGGPQRGWTQKAAALLCKQSDSERYRASPPRWFPSDGARLGMTRPSGFNSRSQLHALGVIGGMLGFQPRGDGSCPSTRTAAKMSWSHATLARWTRGARFSLAARGRKRTPAVNDEQHWCAVRSAKPRWVGSIPTLVSLLPLRTARRLLSAGGTVRHRPGARARRVRLAVRTVASRAIDAGSIPARDAMASPADPAPGLRNRVAKVQLLPGLPTSSRQRIWRRCSERRTTRFDSAREGCGRSRTPMFQGDGALHKRLPRAVRARPSAPPVGPNGDDASL